MIRSILMGAVAGSRSMTPLAAVANAARTDSLPDAPKFLSHPLVSLGTMGLAVYELVGDKQRSAPDRIITPAVVVRTINAAIAGAAVASPKRRLLGAALAGSTALVASYLSWKARMAAIEDHGRVATGFVEDAVVVPAAIAAAVR